MPRDRRPSALLLAATLGAWCLASRPVLAIDPGYRTEIEQFQQKREASLRAEDGWLSVSGLFWLQPGAKRVGSASGSEVALRAGAPAAVGTLNLAADSAGKPGAASFQPAPGVAVRRNGQPFDGGPIQSDADGAKADVLSVGDFRFILLRRNDRYALRLKDNANPARRDFAGTRWFPVGEDWRIVARFKPHALPRTITFDTVVGGHDVLPAPGTVTFEQGGQTHTLEAASESSDGKLWFVFRDTTAGTTTASNARQLTTDAPQGGYVILDFNRAINLPCAYIDHSTCPIAPPQNRLAVAVTAGEQLPRPTTRAGASAPKAD